MHDTIGLRDRKWADAHRAIARAAAELATERGPDAITVADIAAAADVSPRTVFNHFATKDDAILGRDPRRGAAIRAAIEALPPEVQPFEAIRTVLLDVVSQVDDFGASWHQRAELVHRYPSLAPAHMAGMAELESALAHAIATREALDVDADPYPHLVASVALTATRAAFSHAVATGRHDLVRAVEDALDTVARGLPRR